MPAKPPVEPFAPGGFDTRALSPSARVDGPSYLGGVDIKPNNSAMSGLQYPTSRELLGDLTLPTLQDFLRDTLDNLPTAQDVLRNVSGGLTSYQEMTRHILGDLPSSQDMLRNVLGNLPTSQDFLRDILGNLPTSQDMLRNVLNSLSTVGASRTEGLSFDDESDPPVGAPESLSRVPAAPVRRLTEEQWDRLKFVATALLGAEAVVYPKLVELLGDAASPAELMWWSAGLSFVFMLMVVDFYNRRGPNGE